MTMQGAITELVNILNDKNLPIYYEPALKKVIETLEQEPCGDEYIKVPKKALKYRTAGMVVYNAEWLKNHFDIERAVICGAQELCDDAISRQAVFNLMRGLTRWYVRSEDGKFNNVGLLYDDVMFGIDKLPSVNPQPKIGHWITEYIAGDMFKVCSECGYKVLTGFSRYNFCPNCGLRMVEPQESEN